MAPWGRPWRPFWSRGLWGLTLLPAEGVLRHSMVRDTGPGLTVIFSDLAGSANEPWHGAMSSSPARGKADTDTDPTPNFIVMNFTVWVKRQPLEGIREGQASRMGPTELLQWSAKGKDRFLTSSDGLLSNQHGGWNPEPDRGLRTGTIQVIDGGQCPGTPTWGAARGGAAGKALRAEFGTIGPRRRVTKGLHPSLAPVWA